MPKNDQYQEGILLKELAPLLRVIKQLGGKFVFTDNEGEHYVISQADSRKSIGDNQKQLLPARDVVAKAIRKHISVPVDEETIMRVNRDIALMNLQSDDQEDDLAASGQKMPGLNEDKEFNHIYSAGRPKPPPLRVRFEPIKGDLPPTLQE